MEDHNHELEMLDDQHLLRCCRSITDESTIMLKIMIDIKAKMIDAFTYPTKEVGVIENVGFSKNEV